MKPTLVFVYNADSGLFNSLADLAHKIFSPQTYQCNLCAITHSVSGMKQEWKAFLDQLDLPMEFLHRHELKASYGVEGARLPAIFKKVGNGLSLWVDAEAINSCQQMEDLKLLIANKFNAERASAPA
jgi:hypothetical protein